MKRAFGVLGSFMAYALTGCVTPVPGADQVRLVHNAPDVKGCTPVGNVRVARNGDGSSAAMNWDTQLRNQTVGLGGNTLFVTSSLLGEGVAYRCP